MANIPVIYKSGFIDEDHAEKTFDLLWNDLPWERRLDAPRREIWLNTLGTPYTYGQGVGARTYEPHPFPSIVLGLEWAIANYLEFDHDRHWGQPFEGCFVNGYEDQHDSLGWHSDDDPKIDHSRPIVVLTLYEAHKEGLSKLDRSILFRRIGGHCSLHQPVEQGSLLIMKPRMQQDFQHRIPKAGFISRRRISLTFRGLFNDEASKKGTE
jgi:alkylated DNA repair dioxygenase AlkB